MHFPHRFCILSLTSFCKIMPTSLYTADNCSGNSEVHFDALGILSMVFNAIGLVITILIGIVSIQKLETMEQMCIILKSLIYISFIGASLSLLSCMAIPISCAFNQHLVAQILMTITIFGYLVLILSLLLTLITRLYHTFLASVYRMSNFRRNTYWFIYSIIVILSCFSVGLNIGLLTIDQYENPKKHNKILLCSLFFFVAAACLYTLTASWAVYGFTKNLLSLAKTQADTTRNIFGDNEKAKEVIKLSASQKKIINRTARYVTLFGVGMIATIILSVTIFIDAIGEFKVNRYEILLIIGAIDMTVHVITLYLQYSFATKYYNKYCKCLELLWKFIFMRKIINSMRNAQRERRIQSQTSEEIAELTSAPLTSVADQSEGEEVNL